MSFVTLDLGFVDVIAGYGFVAVLVGRAVLRRRARRSVQRVGGADLP